MHLFYLCHIPEIYMEDPVARAVYVTFTVTDLWEQFGRSTAPPELQ